MSSPEDQAPGEDEEPLLPPPTDEPSSERASDPTGDDGAPHTEERDRRSLVEGIELSPVSLVGSFFLRIDNGEVAWRGVVVGEPQAGVYLCTMDEGLNGSRFERAQVLLPIERMQAKDEGYEFRFYDSEAKMQAAYAEYQATAE